MVAETKITKPEPEDVLLKRLMESDLLDVAELGVRINHGVAYIEGYVSSMRQKRLVGKLAHRVPGIREVVNALRIVSLPVIDDDSLRRQIVRALARNPRIDESDIYAEVINGIVHLSGTVATATEKRITEDEAWGTAGVRDVRNDIAVLSAVPKSDSEVEKEILQCFSQCLGLDLSKVSVEVHDGVANLRGTVASDYLKLAAEELVRWVPQVKEVVNELQSPNGRAFGEVTV